MQQGTDRQTVVATMPQPLRDKIISPNHYHHQCCSWRCSCSWRRASTRDTRHGQVRDGAESASCGCCCMDIVAVIWAAASLYYHCPDFLCWLLAVGCSLQRKNPVVLSDSLTHSACKIHPARDYCAQSVIVIVIVIVSYQVRGSWCQYDYDYVIARFLPMEYDYDYVLAPTSSYLLRLRLRNSTNFLLPSTLLVRTRYEDCCASTLLVRLRLHSQY